MPFSLTTRTLQSEDTIRYILIFVNTGMCYLSTDWTHLRLQEQHRSLLKNAECKAKTKSYLTVIRKNMAVHYTVHVILNHRNEIRSSFIFICQIMSLFL